MVSKSTWRTLVEIQEKVEEKPTQVEKKVEETTSISNLGFSTRTEKAIGSVGIKTLGELTLKAEELLKVKGFGPKSFEEVNSIINVYQSQLP